MLLPYTSQRGKKKPHLSRTQQINHHSPSHPQHTVSSTYPRHQSIKTPILKRGAATAQSPRSNQAPQTALSSPSLATLYLPCKPTKTKNPKQGAGENSSPHAYVCMVQYSSICIVPMIGNLPFSMRGSFDTMSAGVNTFPSLPQEEKTVSCRSHWMMESHPCRKTYTVLLEPCDGPVQGVTQGCWRGHVRRPRRRMG
ncbi:hypothetical protein V8C43DRAFT_119797 [Trichoderma afarasin]